MKKEKENYYLQHQKLLVEILIGVQKHFPEIRLFKQHVGKFYSPRLLGWIESLCVSDLFSKMPFIKRHLSRYIIKIGVNGQADLNGIICKNVTLLSGQIISVGIRIELEIKTGRSRQSQDQKRWQAMIEKHGGIYIVARSLEQTIEDIEAKLCH